MLYKLNEKKEDIINIGELMGTLAVRA